MKPAAAYAVLSLWLKTSKNSVNVWFLVVFRIKN
jgi:hypothetical protein